MIPQAGLFLLLIFRNKSEMSLQEHWRKRYAAPNTLGWTTKVWLQHQKNSALNLKRLVNEGTIPEEELFNCLEIGSGNASVSQMFKGSFPNLKIVLSDFLPEVVAKLKTEFNKSDCDLKAIEVDAYTVDAKILNEYDLIYSFGDVSAIGHLEAFTNISKNMRSGTYLVCDFINHLSPIFIFKPTQTLKAFSRYQSYRKYGNGKNFHFGKHGIEKICKKNGLKVLKIYSARYHFLLRAPIILVAQKL